MSPLGRMIRSLTGRLVALALAWGALLLLGGAFALIGLYRTTVYRDVDDRLNGDVSALVLGAELTPEGGVVVTPSPSDPSFERAFSGRYWVIAPLAGDVVGEPVARSSSIYDGQLALDAESISAALAEAGRTHAGSGIGPEGEPLRARLIAITLENDASYVIAAAIDRRSAERDVRRFAFAAYWTLGVFALGLILAIWIQVRLGLRPLFRMRSDVADIREGERERLDEAQPAELAPLARELNALLDHNREVVLRAQAHVGNLAHALKTPLAVMVNEANAADGPFGELARRQLGVMSRQVEHHLKRASAAARAQSVGARTLASDVVDDLARTLPKMYPDKPLQLSVSRPADVYFRGERQDLEEMIGNLLDNAFKWARARVKIRVSRMPDEPVLMVTVEDDGPGLPPAKRSEMVQRGARLDESAPGDGLGLAIVDDLARVHAGKLELGESDLGGLSAVLTLPAGRGERLAKH